MTSVLSETATPVVAPAVPATLPSDSPEAALLPGPVALHRRLEERLLTVSEKPASLIVIGLLRRDTGWPLATGAITTVAALLAGALRGDDWLAREDHTEFAVLVEGSPDAADLIAQRLTGLVTGVITGLHACAGVASLEAGLTPHEVERRAVLCLDAARHRGPNGVVHYHGTR